MKLIQRPVKRVFAFGCSFTKYFWSTWAEIVAFDLGVPLYNYGRTGAGNQYIANTVAQANLKHNFTEDDLVIITWTNVSREDRWKDGGWRTPGNIFTQGDYDSKFVKQWADPIGYMVRDLASIHLVRHMLDNTNVQYHMLSMCDIVNQIDQQNHTKLESSSLVYQEKLKELYKEDISKIHPSFFELLWKNNIWNNKLLIDAKVYGDKFSDGHPDPEEHFDYLKKIFKDHNFKYETVITVNEAQQNLVNFISSVNREKFALYELPDSDIQELKHLTLIQESENLDII